MITVFFIVLITSMTGLNNSDMSQKIGKTQIVISVGNEEFSGSLFNNPTANSLLKQMPFTVELKDYASKEKIFYPKETLNVKSAPTGYNPNVGDITCYGPWGNIAIFYKDHGYADGLILLGCIDNIEEMIKTLESTNNKVVFNIKK